MTQSQMVPDGVSAAQGHVRTERRSPGTAEGQKETRRSCQQMWGSCPGPAAPLSTKITLNLARSDRAILSCRAQPSWGNKGGTLGFGVLGPAALFPKQPLKTEFSWA